MSTLREILVDAVAVGNATARTLFFQTNVPDNFLYEGSYWKRGFFGRDYQFLLDGEGAASATSMPAPPCSTWRRSTPRR